MLKYTDSQVTFAEIPDEITLCINISNCPCHCKGCHSAYLAEDIGEELTPEALDTLINSNKGITCVCFMGGDSDPSYVEFLTEHVKNHHSGIKTAWYSGRDTLYNKFDLWELNYVKVGSYKEELGPLNKRTTNQKLYKVFHFSTGRCELVNITHKFWKEDD